MRTRIALGTALAVTLIPTLFFTLFGDGPASGRTAAATTGTTTGTTTTRPGIKVMSFAEAEKLSQLVTYSTAVTAAQEQQYLAYVAYVNANTIPAAWRATALCEEGGRNDPRAGYFGILAWHGFDGYPTAGSAPLSVQLAWEAAHGQGPPDSPGHCHAY